MVYISKLSFNTKKKSETIMESKVLKFLITYASVHTAPELGSL